MSAGARRVVLDPAELAEVAGGGALPERALHHLVRVLRLGDGDAVELGDGEGRLLRGLLRVEGRAAFVDGATVVELSDADAGDAGGGAILIAGLVKPQRFRLVVEKAVELGARAVIPAICARSNVRPNAEQGEKLAQKWRAVIREAGQQCQRPLLPSVAAPRPLAAVLADAGSWPSLRVLASTRHEAAPWPLEAGGPAVLLVGPEGGFERAEEDDAIARGFCPVSLGAYPLRAETAALALLTLAADRAQARPADGPEGQTCR